MMLFPANKDDEVVGEFQLVYPRRAQYFSSLFIRTLTPLGTNF